MAVGKELFGEGKYVEFKAEIPDRHEKFLKDIIAFSNTSGGKVILGIEDETGDVIGIGDQNPFKLSDKISNMIDDSCVPQIYTDITPRSIGDKTILEIEVFPGRQRPYYLKSKGKEKTSYIRINGTSRPASERKLKELEMEGMKVSYDMLPEVGVSYDENAALALCNHMYHTALDACKTQEERNEVKPLTLEKLEDFGVLRKEGHDYQVTHSFTLLTNPKEYGIKIQCALFKGTERDEFIDRKEFKGPIQEQIEMANQFVLRHINMGAIIEGLFRRDVYELPTRSIREMIINAVLHRSYLDPSPIQVSLFDDRLEIDSPGMLYDGLTVEQAVSGKSRCRNTAIAEAFQYMKLIEAWGTGLPRLYRSCAEMELPEPKFEEFGDGMKVIIYRKLQEYHEGNGTTQFITQSTTQLTAQSTTQNLQNDTSITAESESTTQSASDRAALIKRKIREILQENPEISQNKVAEKLGINTNLAKYYFRKMREDGILIREGSQRKGRWLIQK